MHVSGAASEALREVITGPRRRARVVGAGPCATYLEVGPDVVAILTSDAVRLPCAVFLAHGRPMPPGLAPDTEALVGRGGISWATGELRVQRWWRAAQVRSASVAEQPVRTLATRLTGHALPDGVLPKLEAATEQLSANDVEGAAEQLSGVLGLGSGLTPSADDAVAGLLLGARATGLAAPTVLQGVRALIGDAARARTTAVSAALLAHAAAGRAAPQVITAVDALVGIGNTESALDALWLLGHTSGADTAAGLLVAGRAAVEVSRRAA